ncbi:MAG: response regulator [Firmicutes bacterium]|nr:response regulator [Bacillota bacterium]
MGKKTVLVVDDTAFMRMTLKNILEKNGYSVIGEGEDGLQAIELYKELNPSLVTMDITMPNLDGIKAIEEIIKHDAGAVIIVVSAMGQKALVIDALNAGAKDFVVKPFQPERITEALQKVSRG